MYNRRVCLMISNRRGFYYIITSVASLRQEWRDEFPEYCGHELLLDERGKAITIKTRLVSRGYFLYYIFQRSSKSAYHSPSRSRIALKFKLHPRI